MFQNFGYLLIGDAISRIPFWERGRLHKHPERRIPSRYIEPAEEKGCIRYNAILFTLLTSNWICNSCSRKTGFYEYAEEVDFGDYLGGLEVLFFVC